MPFVKKEFHIKEPTKAFLFLMRQFNLTQAKAQRFIDKGHLLIKGEPIYDKKATIDGDIEVIYFQPNSKGIKPIFITKEFLVYNKPSGILVHPNRRETQYSMLDEARIYGDDVNIVHRLDKETSGLLLASRDKHSERYLKSLFEKREITKTYLAWVKGKIKDSFKVEANIKIRDNYTYSKHKVEISDRGKYAKTEFEPLEYDISRDITLLKCKPLTGRTHQIRVHLFHVKHSILGDPIYGRDFEFTTKYLNGEIGKYEYYQVTGANRLMLHAYSLEFSFGCKYHIFSNYNF